MFSIILGQNLRLGNYLYTYVEYINEVDRRKFYLGMNRYYW